MAVIRVNKTKDFTVMSNAHFKEREMSLKAKGLLSLMLSLPDEWDYSIVGLATLSKDGDKGTRQALIELEKLGYVKRTPAKDEKGRFAGYDYDIFENPLEKSPLTEKRSTEKRSTEKRSTEKPSTEKGAQLNTNTLTTDLSKTNESSIDVVKGAPDYGCDEDKLQPFRKLLLSDNQVGDLLDKMGLEMFDEYVIRLEEYIERTGANVKSHYATILKWYNEDRSIGA